MQSHGMMAAHMSIYLSIYFLAGKRKESIILFHLTLILGLKNTRQKIILMTFINPWYLPKCTSKKNGFHERQSQQVLLVPTLSPSLNESWQDMKAISKKQSNDGRQINGQTSYCKSKPYSSISVGCRMIIYTYFF